MYLSGSEVPVVHDSGWDDSRLIVVAVGAVVGPLIVTQSGLHRWELVEGPVTPAAPELLCSQPHLWTHLLAQWNRV